MNKKHCGCSPKNTCGTKVPAYCSPYGNNNLPDWSELSGNEDCDTVKEALDELYSNLDEVKKSIYLNDLEDSCIDIVPSEEEIRVVDVLNAIMLKVCELDDRVKSLEEKYNRIADCACKPINPCE